jgi:hypothetical protein
VNVSKSKSEKLETGVAAIAAANSLTILRAVPMLAAAARLNLYKLYKLMFTPNNRFERLAEGPGH